MNNQTEGTNKQSDKQGVYCWYDGDHLPHGITILYEWSIAQM
jgi:hypothetical protein